FKSRKCASIILWRPAELMAVSELGANSAWRDFCENPDADSFGQLYEATKAEVWSVALRILRNSADAEDGFQATYLRLWQTAREAEGHAPEEEFRPLMYRLAVRESQNLLKRRSRRRAREVAMENLPETMDESSRIDQRVADKQLLAQIEGLI